MKVADLVKILLTHDQDKPIALEVYGHLYDSEWHKTSHGPMGVIDHDGAVLIGTRINSRTGLGKSVEERK